MEQEVFKLLAAGGDVGTWLVLFALYKLDKRVFMLESRVNGN